MARLKVAKKYAVYGNITILSSIFHARAGALLLPGSNPISPSVYKAKIRETLAHKFCWFRKPSRGQVDRGRATRERLAFGSLGERRFGGPKS